MFEEVVETISGSDVHSTLTSVNKKMMPSMDTHHINQQQNLKLDTHIKIIKLVNTSCANNTFPSVNVSDIKVVNHTADNLSKKNGTLQEFEEKVWN